MKKGEVTTFVPPYDRYALLARLLPALVRAGMTVSPDRLIRLQRLLEALPPAVPAAALGPWLGPIFATDPLQQERFAALMAEMLRYLLHETKSEKPEKASKPVPEKTEKTAPPVGHSKPASEQTARPTASHTSAPVSTPTYSVDIEQCTEPPYSWSIALEGDVPIAEGSEHGRTLARLRSRAAADRRELDWPATLRATVAQAGLPALRYRIRTRPVEYLLLVERYGTDDHRALLFDHLYQNLRRQDVLIERYFHDGDPRRCFNEQHPEGIPLREVRYRHAHACLLFMGNGYRMLSPDTGQPADWASWQLLGWNTRLLLTPLARDRWGLREYHLKNLFLLLPAAWEALRYAAEYPQPDQTLRYAELPDYVRAAAEWPQAEMHPPYLPDLRAQLPEPLLRWVAACAVLPALHFRLTLQLGRLLSDDTHDLLRYDYLARLAALPWFANGHIPKDARAELLEFLDARHPELLQRVSAYLLELLEKNLPENPRSVAFSERHIYIAILRVMASESPDPELVQHLRMVLKRLNRQVELTDFVLPTSVETMLEKLEWEEKAPAPPPLIKQEKQQVALAPGELFMGRYVLEEQVGQGGLADVWKAFDQVTSRLVSLKINRRTDALSEKLAQYEYNMTNWLQHPNINPVLDFGVAADMPFLIFPYRETSASHLIGTATEEDLWKIIRDIGSALVYLHEKKPPVVHNDLKPEHFLLTEEGQWVLSDFGLAEEMADGASRSLRRDPELLAWLKQRTLLPHQVPPEHEHPNLKVNSPTVDIWMFGAALYQIATGNPWMRPALEKGQAVLVSRGFTIFPQEITKLISECLIWQREHRPKAAGVLEIAKKRFEKETEKSPKIYISYRIADSLMQAGRLHQSLEAELGQGTVFYDKDNLKPGMKWSNELKEKVHAAEVVLVLIANPAKWLGVDEFGIRRMDNQDDWVRRELEVALSDSKKLVIPILLNDAQLPPERSLPDSIKPLGSRQLLGIRESNWDQDMGLLLNTLRNYFEGEPETPTKSLEKGQVVEGVVKNITDFGAYLDLGGVSGLLHIDNISWGRIGHPSEVLKVNQRIKVVVLKYKKNKNRFELGLKQLKLMPQLWEVLPADVVEGAVVKGRVVNIQNYGAFVEIMPGVEGLIHISEITWGNQNINAKEYFKLGQEVEARVVAIDRADRKMSLSTKQLIVNPWSDIENRFPVGSRHSGVVKNLTNYGIFVELSEGVGGMVHISDLSWTKRYAHPSEFTKIGTPIDVVVLEIDNDKRQISLGHKQIEENPWDTFETIFQVGSYHEATVLRRDDKGAIFLMPSGLEAFAPAKHIRKEDGQMVEPGETLTVKVIEFNKNDRRILVSHTRYVEDLKYKTETILRVLRREIDMVFVKGGTFLMGEQDVAEPIHKVVVSDFEIGKYPVTQKLWTEIMGSSTSRFKGCDNCPMDNVSWSDIQIFLQKLNVRFPGSNYRLPSEAEWEYAAKGGIWAKEFQYAGSNDLSEVGWFKNNSGDKPHPIGKKKANELGLFDMSGNVWEWCQDNWHETYTGAPIDGRQAWVEGGDADDGVLRGGSWGSQAKLCGVAYRNRMNRFSRSHLYGFRLARDSSRSEQ